MLSLSSVSAIESPLLCSLIGEETLVGDVTVMVDVGVGVDVLEPAFSGMGGAVEDLLGLLLVVCDEWMVDFVDFVDEADDLIDLSEDAVFEDFVDLEEEPLTLLGLFFLSTNCSCLVWWALGPPLVAECSGTTNPGEYKWVLKLGMNPAPIDLEDMDSGSMVRLKFGVAGMEGVDDLDDLVDRDLVDLVEPDFVEEAEDVVDRTEGAMTDLPSSVALTYKLSVLATDLSVNVRERAIIMLYYCMVCYATIEFCADQLFFLVGWR